MVSTESIEEVRQCLRSVLESDKNGLELTQVIKEYRELAGTTIPFRQFGFDSLRSFLDSDMMKDIVRFKSYGYGVELVTYTPCSETAHVTSLVMGQRNDPKNKSKRLPIRISKPARPILNTSSWNDFRSASSSSFDSPSQSNHKGMTAARVGMQAGLESQKNTHGSSPNNAFAKAMRGLGQTTRPTRQSLASPPPVHPPKIHRLDWNTINDPLGSKSISRVMRTSSNTPQMTNNSREQQHHQQQQSMFPSTQVHRNNMSSASNTSSSNGQSYRRENGHENRNGNEMMTNRSEKMQTQSNDDWNSYGNQESNKVTVSDNQRRLTTQNANARSYQHQNQHQINTNVPHRRPSSSASSDDHSSARRISYKVKLQEIIAQNNLPDAVFRTLGHQMKSQSRQLYVAKVIVGSFSRVSGCEHISADDAEEEAAMKLYNELKDKNKKDFESKLCQPISGQDQSVKDKIIDNIIIILKESSSGSWHHNGIPSEYNKKFNENLPTNWIEIAKNCDGRLDVEELTFSNGTRCVISLPNPKAKKRASASESTSNSTDIKSPPTSTQTPTTPSIDDSSHEMFSNLEGSQQLPSALLLPESDTWEVVVTACVSTNEIYVRLRSFADEYANLIEAMHEFYTANTTAQVTQIIEGKTYALKLDEATFRVQVHSIVDEKRIKCIFVDEGDSEVVNNDLLREIDASFLKLPFQAFVCSLHGLEVFEANITACKHLDQILIRDDALIAIPVSRDKNPIPIKLFDTCSSDIDRDIIKEMVDFMRTHAFDDIFMQVDNECDVYVVDISLNGDLYLEIQGDLTKKFLSTEKKSSELCKNDNDLCLKPTHDQIEENLNSKPNTIYYALFDDSWGRCLIKRVVRKNLVRQEFQYQALFIDYGNTETIKLADIRLLKDDPLHVFPYMAVRCRLQVDFEWNQEHCQEFTCQYVAEEILRLKVIKPITSDITSQIPLVVMMNKTSDVSINERMMQNVREKQSKVMKEAACIGVGGDVCVGSDVGVGDVTQVTDKLIDMNLNSNLSNATISGPIGDLKPVDDVLSPDAMPIPSAIMPKVNPNPDAPEDFEDFYVTLAATPYNFYVVPYSAMNPESHFYRQIMLEMQTFYNNTDEKVDLSADIIKEHIFVAAFHNSMWTRARVMQIISKSPMLVLCKLVDTGIIATVEVNDLQPLYTQFRQIPMQAIKAYLRTVQPLNLSIGWEPVACFEFRKLIENKPFVATVYSIVIQDQEEPLIHLDLCDTTGEVDVYVKDFLITNGHASASQ